MWMPLLALTALAFVPAALGQGTCTNHEQLDIVFVVDSSGSISSPFESFMAQLATMPPQLQMILLMNPPKDHWKLVKDFLKGIANSFKIGPKDVRIGLLMFSSVVSNQWYLDTYDTRDSLLKAIDGLENMGHSTSTRLALENAQDPQLLAEHGNRPEVPDLVIVMTDGQSNWDGVSDTTETLKRANILHEANVNTLVVAVGITDTTEIQGISSPPHVQGENWFNVHQFDQLNEEIEPIVKEVCNKVWTMDVSTPNPSTTLAPSTTILPSTTIMPSTTVSSSTTVPAECSHDCSCRLMGDPEILTYDRQVILLSGTNKYTLAQDTSESDQCAYNVEVDVDLISESRPGRDGTSYSFATTEPRSVEISMLGLQITLGQDHSVLLGSNSISLAELPYTGESGGVAYTIKHQQDDADDDFIIFQVDQCQFTSGFEGRDVDSVIVLKRCILEDETRSTGLCGSCDADPTVKNDLKTKAGVDVSGQDDMFQLISESYAVAGSEE